MSDVSHTDVTLATVTKSLNDQRQADQNSPTAPSLGWGGKTGLIRAAGIGGLLLMWAVAAFLTDSRTLPGPLDVARVMASETLQGTLPSALAATLARVCASFAIAMALGVALGFLMGRNTLVDAALDAAIILALNIPALVVMILAYIWMGLNEAAAITAVVITKLPSVVVVIREGARTLDPKLDDIAHIYRWTRWQRLRELILPQLAPYLAASARSGLALVWKIVLVVELLGRSNGIGVEIYTRFQLFDVAGLIAYALTFSAVMLVIEYLALQPLEQRARAWRHG